MFVAPCAVDGDGQVHEVRAAYCKFSKYRGGENDEGFAVIGTLLSGWFQSQVKKILTVAFHENIGSTRADVSYDLKVIGFKVDRSRSMAACASLVSSSSP